MTEALVARIGYDGSAFERGMKAALSTATSTATQIAARYAATATGIDRAFAATARNVGSSLGRELVSAVSPAALAIGGLTAGFLALRFAINEISRAAEAAQERLADLVRIGADARKAAVGTTFLQGFLGQAKALQTEVGTLTAMLDQAREASTIRIGEGDGVASSAIADRLRQNVKAGNLGQVDLDRFTNADSQETRIRVILDLVEQLRAKGANLAALDLAGKMFGSEFESKLRTGTDMIGAMRRALDGLKAGDEGRIIPPEEIQRAENLNRRIEEANRLLTEAMAPIQRDIALWQSQQLASWVDIKEQIAAAAGVLGSFYERVTDIGQYLSRLGQADIFKNLVTSLDRMGMIDHAEGARIERMLNGGLEAGDKPAVPKDSEAGGPLKVVVRPGSDTSRSLPSLSAQKFKAPSQAEISAIETFVSGLEKSAAAMKAEAEAYGLSNVERLTSINLAKAEAVAKQNNVTLTEKEIARIREASAAQAEYRDKLDDVREQQEFVRSTGGEFLKGIYSDARNGVSAIDALANAVKRLADRLADSALDKLADILFGKSGGNSGGLLSGLLGGTGDSPTGGVRLFSDGMTSLDRPIPGYAAGRSPSGRITGPGTGTSDSVLAVTDRGEPIRVSTGESIITAEATRKHPRIISALNEDTLRSFADGGAISLAADSMRLPAVQGMAMDTAAARRAGEIADRQPLPMDLDVNVSGARGNQEIMDMVMQGVGAGLAQYDRKLGRTIHARVREGDRRYG